MKKITIYFAAVMFSALFAGCIDDIGNYEYQPADEMAPKILSELEASYTAIMLEPLVIDPQIDGDEADYEYFWCTYPYPTTTQNRRDTVGYEKKLNYNVGLAPGQYRLVFQAKNKETGASTFQKSIITVTSRFSTGYFVNKYQNGRTDVDFIDADGIVRPNILKTINGDDLPGRPIRSTLSDRYCYPEVNPDGTSTMKNWAYMFMICTDQDMRVYRGNEMTLLYDWDHAFMEAPAVKKPQGVWGTRGGFVMMNNGVIHSCRGVTTSKGTFGYAYPEEGLKMTGKGCAAASNLMFFDENAGSLVGYSTSSDRYAYTQPYAGYERHHFVNQELLCAEMQYIYVGQSAHGFALLRSKVAGEVGKLRLVDVMVGSVNSVRAMAYYGSYEVPAEAAGVGNGKVFCVQNGTAQAGGNSVLYYSTGDNKVHYYNYNNQTHKSNVVEIPADEQIVYMYHNCDWLCNGGIPTHAYALAHPGGFNTFLVLSNKGGNWTLRVYGMQGATPDIDKAGGPKATYTGTGEGVNLICREPHTTTTW